MNPVYAETEVLVEQGLERMGRCAARLHPRGLGPHETSRQVGDFTRLDLHWPGRWHLRAVLKADGARTLLSLHLAQGFVVRAVLVAIAPLNVAVLAYVGSLIAEPILAGVSNLALFVAGGVVLSVVDAAVIWTAFRRGGLAIVRKLAAAVDAETVEPARRREMAELLRPAEQDAG